MQLPNRGPLLLRKMNVTCKRNINPVVMFWQLDIQSAICRVLNYLHILATNDSANIKEKRMPGSAEIVKVHLLLNLHFRFPGSLVSTASSGAENELECCYLSPAYSLRTSMKLLCVWLIIDVIISSLQVSSVHFPAIQISGHFATTDGIASLRYHIVMPKFIPCISKNCNSVV